MASNFKNLVRSEADAVLYFLQLRKNWFNGEHPVVWIVENPLRTKMFLSFERSPPPSVVIAFFA